MNTIQIGDRTIGPGHPVYIIAEAGINHNGDMVRADHMIQAAKEAGADACKFQAYHTYRLLVEQPMQERRKEHKRALLQAQLSVDDMFALKAKCDEYDIEFLCSPFDEEWLDDLVGMGMRAVKVASPMAVNAEFLKCLGAVAAARGLPVLVSTGAVGSVGNRLMQALRAYFSDDAGRVIILHCVSEYPTALTRLNLSALARLAQNHMAQVGPTRLPGLSDHTTSMLTGAVAVGVGAVLLEKHFTLDKSLPGPDHSWALDAGELAEYVRLVRLAEQAMGNG